MRITNQIISSRFKYNLNASLERTNKAFMQIASGGRRYMRGSEDPASATKSFQIRHELAAIDGYRSNLQNAKSHLEEAEGKFMQMNDVYVSVYEKIIQGINGTQTTGDKQIIGKAIDEMQQSIMDLMNSGDNGKYLFGGANTVDKTYTLDENGYLIYNGSKEHLYADIGLGLTVNNGKVDPSSAFQYSLSGEDILGAARYTVTLTDANGAPLKDTDGNVMTEERVNKNNLYNILEDIKKELNKPSFNFSVAEDLLGRLQEFNPDRLKSLTDLGSKTSYIDFSLNRLESQEVILAEKQGIAESIDYETAIYNWQLQQFTYQASLQIGNKILQQSFIDFMR